MSEEKPAKPVSPAALALTALVVAGAGLFSVYQIAIALLFGEITMFSRHSSHIYRWTSNPNYFLAALLFYTVVAAAALWGVARWIKGSNGK